MPQGRKGRRVEVACTTGMILTQKPLQYTSPLGFKRSFVTVRPQLRLRQNGNQIIAVTDRANRDVLESGSKANIVAILGKPLAAEFQLLIRVTECLTSTMALLVYASFLTSFWGNRELCPTYRILVYGNLCLFYSSWKYWTSKDRCC